MEQKKNENLNSYDLYIALKKTEESEKQDSLGNPLPGVEKHHIIPKFDGGNNNTENLVLLTVKEHVIAHWLRWKCLGKQGDYTAFLFRIGDTKKAYLERQKLIAKAREKDKLEGKGFYDSSFQSKMGSRGKGGSVNTEKQFIARQIVGKKHGRSTGISNQSTSLNDFVSGCSIWAFSEKAKNEGRCKNRKPEIFCLVTSKDAFADVARTLNKFVPNSINIHNVSSMHKLVVGKDKRPQMFGWRIVSTLIRSEVREGIQQFHIEYANEILRYKDDFAINEGFE